MIRNNDKSNHNKAHDKPIPTDKNVDTIQGERPVIVNVTVSNPSETDATANSIAERANTIADTANSISKNSKHVNSGLLAVTIVLAIVSTCQYMSANNAAQIAQNTLDTTRKYNDSSLEIQRRALDSQISAKHQSDIADIAKAKREKDAFNLQKDFYNTQSKYYKTTVDEFELENRPFLQITAISIDTTEKNIINGVYFITNAGKQPAKLISAKFEVGARAYGFDINPRPIADYGSQGVYIANGVSHKMTIHTHTDAEAIKVANAVKKGGGFVYIVGDIIYQGPMSKRQYEVTFTYKIIVYPNFDILPTEDYK